MKDVIKFSKFQGAGNDFIIIDNRDGKLDSLSPYQISRLCNRQLGVGADGCLLLENSPIADFRMVLFNSDGSKPRMCGNGLRCFKAYLTLMGYTKESYLIEVASEIYRATTLEDGAIGVEMRPAKILATAMPLLVEEESFTCDLIDTGVPHLVLFVDTLDEVPVMRLGPPLRSHSALSSEGANVNFATLLSPYKLALRTYERGVEAETLACGTGATATAISAALRAKRGGLYEVRVSSGATLKINLTLEGANIGAIFMSGPASPVFHGEISSDHLLQVS